MKKINFGGIVEKVKNRNFLFIILVGCVALFAILYFWLFGFGLLLGAKEFEKIINRHAELLTTHFNERAYYGEPQILKWEPFICEGSIQCFSPKIVLGWLDTPNEAIILQNNSLTLKWLSSTQAKGTLETEFQFQFNENELSIEEKREISLIKPLLPKRLSCHFTHSVYGTKSIANSDSTCTLFSDAIMYQFSVDMDTFSFAYANAIFENLLGEPNHYADSKMRENIKVAIRSFDIKITSKSLDDAIYNILEAAHGSVFTREIYEKSIDYGASVASNFLIESVRKVPIDVSAFVRAVERLKEGGVSILTANGRELALFVRLKNHENIPFANEELLEELQYNLGYRPHSILRSLIQNYDFKVEYY
ncbi:hypothetical protein CCZ01_03610 [Helicobacter monodelphidis]|uniref:hypothetical protein n=1 Tax=Helicobacter sp. 15-1451 TaxID=2004995 RepID=UPI000DCD37D4|nr:hypothetical protein [Helicobacter sp. 15-1451]RAX58172.1 hypothetical protein CCZ01_03610 [Helicobacter sp. 15-1451]